MTVDIVKVEVEVKEKDKRQKSQDKRKVEDNGLAILLLDYSFIFCL
jgi:hypothetical protein